MRTKIFTCFDLYGSWKLLVELFFIWMFDGIFVCLFVWFTKHILKVIFLLLKAKQSQILFDCWAENALNYLLLYLNISYRLADLIYLINEPNWSRLLSLFHMSRHKLDLCGLVNIQSCGISIIFSCFLGFYISSLIWNFHVVYVIT